MKPDWRRTSVDRVPG